MHTRAQNENDQLNNQIGKVQMKLDKFIRSDKMSEKVIEKLHTMGNRKDTLIKD